MAEGRYLLVVSITQGQQFPARNGKEIVIHGKFNDELLTSDPVPHDSNPQINTGFILYIDFKLSNSEKMFFLIYGRISEIIVF